VIIYFFHLSIGLILILLQTTILYSHILRLEFYNLLTPFILFVCLFRPLAESLPVTLILGLFFDSLSGAPFGLYTTVFFWIFVGVRWSTQYFHAGSIVLLPLIAGCTIVVENFIVITAVVVLGGEWHLPASFVKSALVQITWGTFFGTLFLMAMNLLFQRIDEWLETLAINRKEIGG